MVDWYDNWDRQGLPGQDETLSFRNPNQFRRLFVRTNLFNRIDEILDSLPTTAFRRFYVLGERGTGKSTVINYSYMTLAENISKRQVLPLYAPIGSRQAESIPELQVEFLLTLLYAIKDAPDHLNELEITLPDEILSVVNPIRQEFDKMNLTKRLLIEDAKTGTLQRELKSFVEMIADHCQRIAIFVDDIDHQNEEIAVGALGKLQSVLTGWKKCVFFISGRPKWIEFLESGDYTGISGNNIHARSWTMGELESLLDKRLSEKAIFDNPFSPKSISIIAQRAASKPRDFLRISRIILDSAAENKMSKISGKFVEEYAVWQPSSVDAFVRFINENPKLYAAWVTLRDALRGQNDYPRSACTILAVAHSRGLISRNTKPDGLAARGVYVSSGEYETILDSLARQGCLIRKKSAPDIYRLDSNILKLFEFISEQGESILYLPELIPQLNETIVEPPLDHEKDKLNLIREVFKRRNPGEWLDSNQVVMLVEQTEDKFILEQKFDYYAIQLVQLHELFVDSLKRYRRCPEYIDDITHENILRLRESKLIDAFVRVVYQLKRNELNRARESLRSALDHIIIKLHFATTGKRPTSKFLKSKKQIQSLLKNIPMDAFQKDLLIITHKALYDDSEITLPHDVLQLQFGNMLNLFPEVLRLISNLEENSRVLVNIRERLEAAFEEFNDHHYKAGIKVLKNMIPTFPEASKKLIEILIDIMTVYENWDKAPSRKLIGNFEKILKRIETAASISPPFLKLMKYLESNIMALKQIASETKNFTHSRSEWLAADYYFRAIRKTKSGDYNRGIQFLYKAIEILTQTKLVQQGIIPTKMEWPTIEPKVLEAYSAHYSEFAQISIDEVPHNKKIGMVASYSLLGAIEPKDCVVKSIHKHKSEIRKLVNVRNTLSEEHELKIANEKQCEECSKAVKTAISCMSSYEDAENWFTFAQLDASLIDTIMLTLRSGL